MTRRQKWSASWQDIVKVLRMKNMCVMVFHRYQFSSVVSQCAQLLYNCVSIFMLAKYDPVP